MDIRGWEERYRTEASTGAVERFGPTRLVVNTALQLPKGQALDLACGSGRNALWLAADGWQVEAVDGSAAAIELLQEGARTAGLAINAHVADLQDPSFLDSGVFLAEAQRDLLIICYYLQRDLIARAQKALRPGGVFLVIVHITEGEEEPTPSRLRPGDLEQYFNGWEILHRYEGKPDDPAHRRAVAEIVARKQA